MSRFIPRNEEATNALNEHLASTIFNDVETFVKYYNSGLINRNNDETKEIVKSVVDAFKDVREKRGKLAFVSESEILLDESLSELSKWVGVVRVKREVGDAISENASYNEDTIFVIDSDGALAVELEETDENGLPELSYEPVGADKVKDAEVDGIVKATGAEIAPENVQEPDGDKLVRFRASAILNLDDSFIGSVRATVRDLD